VTGSENKPELLVEILLGLLSKHSALRKLVEQVFSSFASTVTSTALKLIMDVLTTPETLQGGQELFNNEADEDLENEEDEEDDEAGGYDGQDEDEEGEGENEGEGEGEDEDEDELMAEDMDIDADEELDRALSTALGTQKESQDASSSDQEELMNDDEMMALDDNLATIFYQHYKPSRAKQAKDTKERIAIFKSKVVNLLEILIQTNSTICLEMILPCLQALHLTKSDAVHSKLLNVLRKLSKSKELPNVPENLLDLLRKIHEQAAKAKPRDGNIHSQLGIFIARIARQAGQEEEILGVYMETLRKWIKDGKSQVKAALFSDLINWCQSIR
jgi:DNA polymerase phi